MMGSTTGSCRLPAKAGAARSAEMAAEPRYFFITEIFLLLMNLDSPYQKMIALTLARSCSGFFKS